MIEWTQLKFFTEIVYDYQIAANEHCEKASEETYWNVWIYVAAWTTSSWNENRNKWMINVCCPEHDQHLASQMDEQPSSDWNQIDGLRGKTILCKVYWQEMHLKLFNGTDKWKNKFESKNEIVVSVICCFNEKFNLTQNKFT